MAVSELNKNCENICPNAQICGGCSYQGVSYEQQLANKLGEVKGCFRANGLNDTIISGIEPAVDRFGYRNKMEYTFGNAYVDGPMLLGLHKKGSYMSIIDTSCCMIVPEDFNRILSSVLRFCLDRGYTHYHKKFHTGFLRNLVLRRGVRTGELLVNIVTTSSQEFDKEGFVSMLLDLKLDNSIVGIVQSINDDLADAVNINQTELLWGRSYYAEKILGLDFKVGIQSFFQTNVSAAERLYSDALALVDDPKGKTVYDLYCGTGTITQALALKAKHVVGIEIVAEAIETARESASMNGLSNCTFIADDVQKALDGVPELPDMIVVDPPRSGITPKALSKILSYGVDQLLYISCNPKTLAENLRGAMMAGYKISYAKAYDNFPFTKHVETVVLMSRVNVKRSSE